MILGAQLFGICYSSPLGTEETLQKLKEIGYELIEPCVSLEAIPGMEKAIWPAATFEELYPRIKAMGLNILSMHFFAKDLAGKAEWLKAFCEKYGIRYVVVKSPRNLDILSLQAASMEYLTVADSLAEVGAKLLIHNEAADIETKIEGKSAYEYLLDLCQNRVYAQVDAGWVRYAGEDEIALINRNLYRTASIHYKDFSEDKQPVVVGRGIVDLKGCFEISRAHGLPHIVDQDRFSGDVFEEMQEIVGQMMRLGQGRSNRSYLNVMNIETGEITTLRSYDKTIEAPNWLATTDELIYNSEGHLYAYSMKDGSERMIETGECDNCNNDHVLAADGSGVAVSHGPRSAKGWTSLIYTIPFATGVAKQITPEGPSFLHGWSPDCKELAYCAFRQVDGERHVDIYTIPADGTGVEKRLTCEGFNDGPEYSPDGKYIWFISTRTGLMQIWRMKTDGSEQTQITFNDMNNWFGHVSPDGKKVVYLAYHVGHLSPYEHLPNMQVELWAMNSDGSDQHRILSFFGGQGSINVNSWAPDSKRFAFVSYEMQ